nr:unnamed protein product [Digitaria exilis]
MERQQGDEASAAAAAGVGEEEVVQIGAQKHDPAWKHCLMVRSDGRVRIKCAYCGKHFLGGGIHRFKEHLARRPGNACCCPSVPRDVQDTMLRSLEAVAAKKMQRKLAHALPPGDMRRFAAADASPASAAAATESPIHMIPLNEVLDFNAVPLQEQRPQIQDTMRGSATNKKKRKLMGNNASTPPPLTPQYRQQPHAPPTPQTNPLHQVVMAVDAVTPSSGYIGHPAPAMDKEQVSMAVGRFLYDVGVPLDAVNSVYFQPMLEAIASAGGRPEALSYHDFRGDILKSTKRPAMGYVYAGLYRAKAAIKKELVRKNDYMAYWNIIDWRWDSQTPRPLHSAVGPSRGC